MDLDPTQHHRQLSRGLITADNATNTKPSARIHLAPAPPRRRAARGVPRRRARAPRPTARSWWCRAAGSRPSRRRWARCA
eukprot:1482657-Prymnesium_polylepis.1